MNHKKLIILGIRAGLVGTLTTLGRELPVDTISHPTCKGKLREELDDNCKLLLFNQGVVPQETETLGNLIFSVLRGSSYTQGHVQNSGGHPSLDIVTTKGTPVYAVGNGHVLKAGFIQGFGNSITIQHILNGEPIYSNYSHLSEIDVEIGAKVDQGQRIGEVGRSGFSMGPYGYHLDFQITTKNSPSHPYGFHDCEYDYMTAVNEGKCNEKLRKYTIDPIEFFTRYTAINLRPITGIQEEKKESNIFVDTTTPTQKLLTIKDHILANNSLPSMINDSLPPPIVQEEKQEKDTQPSQTQEVKQVLAGQYEIKTNESPDKTPSIPYKIDRFMKEGTYKVGKIQLLTITVYDKLDAPVSGQLEEKIYITYDDSKLEVLPDSFQHIINGKKHIFIKSLQPGDVNIAVRYGDTILGEENIIVKE